MADVVTPLALPAAGDRPPIIPVDWAAVVVVTSTYRTDITVSATTLTEERRSLTPKPVRDVQARLTGMSRAQSHQILQWLIKNARNRVPVPLWSDQSEVTATSSATTIYCDTRYRRFFDGGRVLIYRPRGAGTTGTSEYARIQSHTDSTITLKSADVLSGTFAAGSIVVPVIDAELSLGDSGGGLQMVTDEIGYADVRVSEVLGPSTLPGEETGTPTGFDTFGTHPILSMEPDWDEEVSVMLSRDGQSADTGRTNFVWAEGASHRVGHSLRFGKLDREDAAAIRRFFDSRIGRLRPFWLISLQTVFSATAKGSTYIDVADDDGTQDFSTVTHIGVRLLDGTHKVHLVTTVVETVAGVTWRISFASDTSYVLDDIRSVSIAHFVRFNQDSLEEQWDTDGVCGISVETIELIQEGSAVVTDATTA